MASPVPDPNALSNADALPQLAPAGLIPAGGSSPNPGGESEKTPKEDSKPKGGSGGLLPGLLQGLGGLLEKLLGGLLGPLGKLLGGLLGGLLG